GWISRGISGLFPEVATEIEDRYDVVSMHHYLEHTRDPQLEFRTAHSVLKQGGYILVEVPNPTTPYGGLLKSFWLPWLQPEHQHFLNQANFERLLGRTGFEIVQWRWQDAHVQTFALSALLALYRYAPPASPWLRLSL